MYSQIGKRIPVYACGVGKVLLMQKSDEEIREELGTMEFETFTSKTFSDVDELINRQALHSYKMEFIHPVSKNKLLLEADIPEDINKLII